MSTDRFDVDPSAAVPTRRSSALADRPPRRPSSARSSIVQQKLQAALLHAEKTGADLVRLQKEPSFRPRGVAAAAAEDSQRTDRSVSRYRNDAAIVSFSDPSTPFAYTPTFLPGVHFYTFLASKDTAPPPPSVPATGPAPTSKPTESVLPPRPSSASRSRTSPASALLMNVPDTIVYGETGRAVWIYTDEEGHVQRLTDFTEKTVLEKFVAPGAEHEPVVVCKEPMVGPAQHHHHHGHSESGALAYQGNLLRLLTYGELKTLLSNVSSTRSTKSFALQRFVKCNGSKAFIVRGVYEAGKPHYAWMINNTIAIQEPTPTVSQVLLALGQEAVATAAVVTGARSSSISTGSNNDSSSSITNVSESGTVSTGAPAAATGSTSTVPLVNRLCTSIQVDKSCTFIKLNERGCASISEMNVRVVKYIEQRLHIQLQTLVADYVKDTAGKWWLLQIKAFHVRRRRSASSPGLWMKPVSLPVKLRLQYLSYRDSSVLEETTDSEDEQERQAIHHAAQLAQRQVRKLMQCKCCLAAYPKTELSFKMTLKMINEMLIRIRSRLAPDKSYTFLTAALAREPPDPSLAYESWSVCSYCYAIYERDQQLLKMETKFAQILGTPCEQTALDGLSKIQDRSFVIDPNASTTVLPPQLTLCRLMLVINGIYDIPPELYDAEQSVSSDQQPAMTGHGKHRSHKTVQSRLYLRITSLGYTECIPIDPREIIEAREKAPRGVRQRQASTVSLLDDDDLDDGETTTPRPPGQKPNYWLPINLIRTIHFFAPRTPLQAKLKETSGLAPFLNDDSSILVQFIRATEPPLQDPTTIHATTTMAHRARTRRAALTPHAKAMSDMMSQMHAPNHCILLGATTIRMAQFRSAYVTKIDFYACMALSGEMFNIKGNIGLERLRYVDTKLLTTQHRLRSFNGVFIPDDTYMASDALSSEWMDCLRVTFNPHTTPSTSSSSSSQELQPDDDNESPTSVPQSVVSRSLPRSSSSVSFREEMDEELMDMIDRVNVQSKSPRQTKKHQVCRDDVCNTEHTTPIHQASGTELSVDSLKQELRPTTTTPSRFDSQMTMLMTKTVLSPRSALADESTSTSTRCAIDQPVRTLSPRVASPRAMPSSEQPNALWCFVLHLNHAYNLRSRERQVCRWECHYSLFGQRRSAVERSTSGSCTGMSPPPSPTAQQHTRVVNEVQFSGTHKFFLVGSAAMVQSHLRSNRQVTLHLRNDVYASTRSQSNGEFHCVLDLSAVFHSKTFDATLDIVPTSLEMPDLTPREAADIAQTPPYLSVSVQLTQLMTDPDAALSNGDYVVVGSTTEGLQVVKKIV